MSLCDEYKEQLKIVNKSLEEKTLLKKSSSKIDKNLLKNMSDLHCAKDNLEMSIYWMSHSHEKNVYEGIDNLKACRVY
jgi:hypothetical protein